MVHSTNLLLLVGQKDSGDFSPRKATFYRMDSNKVFCSLWPFPKNITLAKINKERVVFLEGAMLHIYSTCEFENLHNIDLVNEIYPNLICLSPSVEYNNYLLYSTNQNEGIIKVYDLQYLTYKTSFQAHVSAIEKMNINHKGNMVVTSSVKGNMIRVFSLPKGDKLFFIKRGYSSAVVYSMNFLISDATNKIVLSSETGTLHVIAFDGSEINENAMTTNTKQSSNNTVIEQQRNEDEINNISNGIFGFVSKIINKDYDEIINYKRPCISTNFSELKGVMNIVSFKQESNGVKVFVITENGDFISYVANYQSASLSKISTQNLMKVISINVQDS